MFSYDKLGDAAYERLNAISSSQRPRFESGVQEPALDGNGVSPANPAPRTDLYALLRDNADNDEVLGTLWTQANAVPNWVDWEQIQRGQEVFYRYGGAALTGLAFQSLLGGMVSKPDVNLEALRCS